MYNYNNEFENYAKNHLGISGIQLHYWNKLQERIYGFNASLTPYILEEREMRATQMDIFSRLMMDRIIWVAGVVNDNMSTVLQAQLMFLDTISNEDITMHIDTPGGSTKSGKSIIDVVDYISSDVSTINTGMAASMGSLLLGCGTKGKRFTLPSSKVMLHQVSSGAEGNVQDMRISLAEAEKENDSLFELLSRYTGKEAKEIMEFATRDRWLDSTESVNFGLVDAIITAKDKKKK